MKLVHAIAPLLLTVLWTIGSFNTYTSPYHQQSAAKLSVGESASISWAEALDSHGEDGDKLISGDDVCVAGANCSSVAAASIISEHGDFQSPKKSFLVGLFVRAP